MEPFEDDPKEIRIRRTSPVGPNFGAIQLMERKTMDSEETVRSSTQQQPSVKLHVSSRLLPFSLVATPSYMENVVVDVDENLNIINTLQHYSDYDSKDTRILAGCFHPRSNHIVLAASGSDIITFWDARVPSSFRKIIGPHIVRKGLEIHPIRNEILTCSWRREDQIQLWDFDSGKLISVLEPDGYQSSLYCGKYFAHNLLATGGIDPNLLRVINMRTSKNMAKIRNLPGGVYSLDIGWSKENLEKRTGPRILFCCGKKLYEADLLDYELSF
ncbi:uncharacterized protein LOC123295991 [Chrysoperla carnea]|uniref:uncharacterized protein LOC123295991 n=1 Tax=Chrysoperla carnea TaxID=189513 RepID=UPI001D066474|nr:uncharacterized protein LOC123295991 [Chrysoperla carnea]